MHAAHECTDNIGDLNRRDPCNTRSMTSTLNEQSPSAPVRPVGIDRQLQGPLAAARRRMTVVLDTQQTAPHVRRIRAADLGLAASTRRRIATEETDAVVLLDLEFLIAPTARDARMAYAGRAVAHDCASATVRYIGTPSGLAGLIADIGAAHVADGVVLTDVGESQSTELLATETLSALVLDGILDIDTSEALRVAATATAA